jgi:glycosyltransferase involved in cell wall biosynthesis
MSTGQSEARLKVLFIISNFPPHGSGGERQAFILAKTLCGQGIQVEVLTRYWSGLKREDLLDGVPVHRRGPSLGGKLGSVLGAFSWAIYTLQHGRQYQVFHAQQPYSALWVAMLSKLLWRGRVIFKIPGTGAVRYLKHSWLKRAVTKRYVDVVIAVNYDHRDELIKLGLPSSCVLMIPNGVDLAGLRPRTHGRREGGERSVVFVGRLVPTKGVDVLLESWKVVQEKMGNPPSLYIIGDGSERSRLERQATTLNRNVHFTGRIDHFHVQCYLECATLLVSPSRLGQEGLSNALLEAMAAGLPIVATEVEGTRDVVRDGQNGLLVEPGSSRALTSALLRLLRDSDLSKRLGRAARETVERAYSIEAVARQYHGLYTELVSGDR